jgi:hypothetical protein
MAASGGNHGAAVAYASIRIGIPAKIFVPSISSPVKVQRIRHYRAERVVSGDRYDDALAASEVWAEQSGERSRSTPSISAKPCWVREQSGWRWSSKVRVLTPSSSRLEATGLLPGLRLGLAARSGWLALNRKSPNAHDGAQGRGTGRRAGWWHRGGSFRTPARRNARVPHRQAACGPRSPGSRRRDPTVPKLLFGRP